MLAIPKTEVVSLLDLTLRHELVDIGDGQKLAVYALSGRNIAYLTERFPILQGAMLGAGINFATVKKVTPEVLSAIIAAATCTREMRKLKRLPMLFQRNCSGKSSRQLGG